VKRKTKKKAKPITDAQALRKRVYSLRGSISRDGSAKLEILEIENAVKQVLGKLCIYCESELSIDNVSGDHRVSLKNGGSSTLENIEFQICKGCNAGKSEFDADAFKALMAVANKYGITKKLLAKLKYSNFQFKRSYN
jgi:5-methylcytosine-specific restriction endonuclease McrA